MDSIQTTHVGFLPYRKLSSNEALKANILPNLKSASLVSLGQLCDDNCDIALNKKSIRVYKNNKEIMQGPRNYSDGLWDIHIPTQKGITQQSMSVIIQKSKTKRELVNFYHAACFSPSIPTFYKAVKNGNFQSWPGLTTDLITKFLQPTIATHFDHLNQERQNLQPTQQPTETDFFPIQEEPNKPTNQMMATIVPYRITQKAYGLAPFGYEPIANTDSFWRHKTDPTKFCLCVDDFGIKYYCKSDLNKLISALQVNYKISTDFTGRNYCGLTIDWEYDQGYVDISMPGYVHKALDKFQYEPKLPQYSPHEFVRPNYGHTIQFAKEPEKSPSTSPKQTKRVQAVAGTFLYYSRAIDPTMIVALNEIASVQSKPTYATIKKCERLMDYAATYPCAKLRYFATDMVLHVDSDAAYLV